MIEFLEVYRAKISPKLQINRNREVNMPFQLAGNVYLNSVANKNNTLFKN